jgi:arsenate reductase (glutaredoxin)
LNIQIFGIKKCVETRKAERFFKERRIPYQFIDMNIKSLSKRELQSVSTAVGINNLVNPKSKDYASLNMDRILSAAMREEMLLKYPTLYRTPIVRNGKQATVGYEPETWAAWD